MILSFTPLTNHSIPLNIISLKTLHVLQLGFEENQLIVNLKKGKTECMLQNECMRRNAQKTKHLK